ncbi:MAG: NTP/NDP exchange transporter [Chlamydiales bacterium]|nr:NTP/NDP exchange transporter [Chlamydiales bacterium]
MQKAAQANNPPAFGKIRSFVWPIHTYELKKLMPMFLMLFFVCFNYTVLRNLKDTIIITAKDSGAEVIPFIKVWVMLPAAVIATMLFTYLTNHFKRSTVFYIVISSFISFYCLFAFVIYPMHEQLSADRLADFLQTLLPAGCKGFITMTRNWSFTLFYVASELWSTMVLSVLFWGFANEITRMSEATRFYSALNISSNSASIVAGQVAVALTTNVFNPNLFFGHDAWSQTVDKLTLLLLFCGIGIILTFRWMKKNVLNDPAFMPEEPKVTKEEPKRKKLSFRESIAYITNSKYFLCIAAMVVSYNLVIHMVEIIWKDRLRELYPNPADYNVFTNNLTSAMGIISTTAALVMVGIIRKFGWTKTALITPIVLLVTTIAFFGCLLADNTLSPFVVLLGTTPLALAVLVGSIQNCFTKAAKYSLFDTTKEMAFIPIAPELKLKGKAAIDGIGSRLGKSGGSLIHQGLLITCLTLSNSTPYVAAILLAVIAVWILAVRTLGKQFDEKTKGINLTGEVRQSAPTPSPAPSAEPIPVTA